MFSKYLEPACRVFCGKAKKEIVSMNGMEVQLDDEQAIRELCQKVFPADGQMADPSTMWNFNTVLVRVAEQYIVKPNFDKILGVVATTAQVDKNTSLVEFTVEKDYNIKFSMIANGSGHKLVKIGDSRKIAQMPFTIGFGATYDPLTKTEDEVEWFKKAVAEIGRAEIAYIYNKVLEMAKAVSGLPTKNVVEGSGVTYAQVRELASVLRRRTGGKPILIADQIMLDSLAQSMVGDAVVQKLMFDSLAEHLFGEYAPKNFGTFDGVEMENPFINAQNSAVALPVGEAIMVAGAVKPFAITKIGGMTQKTNTELKDGKVQFWCEQELAITLLYPQMMGRVSDDSLSL